MEVGSGAQNEPMLEDEESPTTGSYSQEKDKHLEMFHGWSGKEQVDFIESLISRTDHNQQAEINEVLSLLLQRDFISLFPSKYKSYFSLVTCDTKNCESIYRTDCRAGLSSIL